MGLVAVVVALIVRAAWPAVVASWTELAAMVLVLLGIGVLVRLAANPAPSRGGPSDGASSDRRAGSYPRA